MNKFTKSVKKIHRKCKKFIWKMLKMDHPWKILIEQIRDRWWTQKQFSVFVWKKNSEVNELIKWKRNITVQWDLILADILWTPEKYWINLQVEYDYNIAKIKYNEEKNNKKTLEPEVIDKNDNRQNNSDEEKNTTDFVNQELQKLPEKDIQKELDIEKEKQIEKRKILKKIWREF